ncbi:potassium channel subfamily U member 1 isoform X2 [Hyperolius riggenbachi]|uniref:potassium channel subfamily U member 1 isoform X2 n=1 Tax=Hyperolius riggenbachi TaxID=752182 RepID=UPI0035A2F69E
MQLPMAFTALIITMNKWMVDPHCAVDKRPFLFSSLAVFLGGLLVILLWRLVKFYLVPGLKQHINMRRTFTSTDVAEENNKVERAGHATRMIHSVQVLLAAQTYMGVLLVILVFLLSIGTVIIYFIISADPSKFCSHLEKPTLMADLGFNVFFALYFCLRFIAADDKLKFWLQMASLVDFFTIPPMFVSVYLRRNWLGLRFLRALRLMELPRILQMLKVTKTSTAIKLSKLLVVFLSSWLTSAGFIHLLENAGDPWTEGKNAHNINYFDCMYLLMVTMSTVGYGDITAKTVLGRLFILFFIAGGLVLFAGHVPEIVDIVGSSKKYSGSYGIVGGRKHIVVCGYITLDTVSTFIKDFMHKDRGEITTEIIFMEEIQPSLELEALLKCNMQTTFFYGSVLNYNDLARVKMERADAVMVLSNRCCSDPEHEDASNIMRVISIKNYYPGVRVIIQILQSCSKTHLQNIPNWDWRIGDSIICLSELTLGFMAQSCILPGLSTILINLCSMKEDAKVIDNSWQWHYLDSVGNSLLTATISNDFVGMSFPAVCKLCFVKMNIVLMAIEYRTSAGISILVNPSEDIELQEDTVGFFIARHFLEAKRDTTMRQEDGSNPTLDSTGMFHWCKAIPLQQATLGHQTAAQMDFEDHILVSIFGDVTSASIGLRDFVMPLRASNFSYEELKPIVFLGSLSYIQREWQSIQNFPKLFVFPGSGLSCANLRAVNIQHCAMSVVLSAHWMCSSKYLDDTECILATLNMRSMQFKPEATNTAVLQLPSIRKEPAFRIPVITELRHMSNITFIQQNISADHKHPTTTATNTDTFACGAVISACLLDSLMAMTYYDWHLLPLLQTLVTGGSTPELEEQLAEANKLSTHNTELMAPRDRSKLSLIPMNDYRMSALNVKTYGELFCRALASLGIICFGVYRLMDPPNLCQDRYVITRPGKNFPLDITDLLYCVVPYAGPIYLEDPKDLKPPTFS